jgi:hypothetical protein
MSRLRRPRQPPAADVDLQRLMQQPGLAEAGIARRAHRDKLVLGNALLQVLILPPVIANAHAGDRAAALGWIIMANPEAHAVRQVEQLVAGLEQAASTAAREVAASGADVYVEDGIATEGVVYV